MTFEPHESEEHVDEPRRTNRSLGVVVAILLIAAVAIYGARAAADWVGGLTGDNVDEVTAPSVAAGEPITIVIPSGASARTIGELLASRGVVGSSLQFETAVRLAGADSELRAGEYDLFTGMENDDVITALTRGPVVDTYWITVREGLRIGEILQEIAEQTDFLRGELEALLLDGSITTSLFPDGQPSTLREWEGLLFPDTYEFLADSGPEVVLALLAGTMERRVGEIDWSELEEAGYSQYDSLIIASLIESETRANDERPLVSAVVANRLSIGMALQIDATVLYALGERRTGLTLTDLEVDSPYNTYLQPGLPPTPIGGPGRASLEAAAAPAAVDYLFYVLTSRDGTHSFTASYDEFLSFKNQAKEDGVLP
jgi:UPF0755 protein